MAKPFFPNQFDGTSGIRPANATLPKLGFALQAFVNKVGYVHSCFLRFGIPFKPSVTGAFRVRPHYYRVITRQQTKKDVMSLDHV
jgi:hypothetical protein